MIDGIFQSSALPTLERLLQFTEQRHQVLVNDIANLSTPFFKPADLNPKEFQQSLAGALDKKHSPGNGTTPANGPLELEDTEQLKFTPDWSIQAQPEASNEGILFHDQNNRDLERLMAHLAENNLAHNTAVELMRSEMATLRSAIRGTM